MHTRHRDGRRSGTAHPCAERAQIRLQVVDLRLAGRVMDHGLPLRDKRAEHGVLRGADARKRQDDLRAAQRGSPADEVSPALGDLRAERAQRLQMQVYRPRTELTAARKAQPGLPAAGEDRSEENDRRAQLAHERWPFTRTVNTYHSGFSSFRRLF